MKITNTFNSSDGTVSYVEFVHNGKTKLLSREHFEFRFGNDHIDEFKRGTSDEEDLNARLSVKEEKELVGAYMTKEKDQQSKSQTVESTETNSTLELENPTHKETSWPEESR